MMMMICEDNVFLYMFKSQCVKVGWVSIDGGVFGIYGWCMCTGFY